MELMDMSLDKFLERVQKLNKKIAEPILGKIAFSVNTPNELTVLSKNAPLFFTINRRICVH